MPKIDENTAISDPGTYYVYAKTAETTNYEEDRSATVALTVTEPAAASVTKADGTDGGTYKTLPCGAGRGAGRRHRQAAGKPYDKLERRRCGRRARWLSSGKP